MSAKKYFEKQKNKQGTRGLSKSSAADFIDNVESKKFVKEYNKNKEQFIPDVDFLCSDFAVSNAFLVCFSNFEECSFFCLKSKANLVSDVNSNLPYYS